MLNGVDPGGDGRDVVGLVHDTEDDTLIGSVLLSELGPDASKLVVGRATLGDDSAIPASVVVLG